MAELDRQFRMNPSEDELRQMRELAEAEGLSASDYLRVQIRRAYAERIYSPRRRQIGRDFARRTS